MYCLPKDPWEPTAGAKALRFTSTDPDPAGPSPQVSGSPFDASRPGQTPDSCLGVKGSPVQIRPSRLVVKFFEYMCNTPEPSKEPFPFETALPEARTDHTPTRPTRASAKPRRTRNQPVKGSNTAKPPLLCKGIPHTCEPADTIPGRTSSPQAGRSPGVSTVEQRGKRTGKSHPLFCKVTHSFLRRIDVPRTRVLWLVMRPVR
jgi:hypothetical protein